MLNNTLLARRFNTQNSRRPRSRREGRLGTRTRCESPTPASLDQTCVAALRRRAIQSRGWESSPLSFRRALLPVASTFVPKPPRRARDAHVIVAVDSARRPRALALWILRSLGAVLRQAPPVIGVKRNVLLPCFLVRSLVPGTIIRTLQLVSDFLSY